MRHAQRSQASDDESQCHTYNTPHSLARRTGVCSFYSVCQVRLEQNPCPRKHGNTDARDKGHLSWPGLSRSYLGASGPHNRCQRHIGIPHAPGSNQEDSATVKEDLFYVLPLPTTSRHPGRAAPSTSSSFCATFSRSPKQSPRCCASMMSDLTTFSSSRTVCAASSQGRRRAVVGRRRAGARECCVAGELSGRPWSWQTSHPRGSCFRPVGKTTGESAEPGSSCVRLNRVRSRPLANLRVGPARQPGAQLLLPARRICFGRTARAAWLRVECRHAGGHPRRLVETRVPVQGRHAAVVLGETCPRSPYSSELE